MASFTSPTGGNQSKESGNQVKSAVGGVCLFCWGIGGLVVIVGLVSKFFGLI